MTSRRVLIIDDDQLYCQALSDALDREGFETDTAQTLSEARARAPEGYPVVLLDNRLGEADGLQLVPELLAAHPRTKIMLCTAFPHLENAVEALRMGLFDYHQKPVEVPKLISAIHHAFKEGRLEQRVLAEQEQKRVKGRPTVSGRSPVSARLKTMVERAAAVESPVLLTGETGTGKTMIARMIHEAGDPTRPFIHVNCAALPEGLVESELFGSERGAFTGASQAREGLFELADGGTLFLDEVGELPNAMQAKLLLALEEGWVRRVGGSRSRRVRVRLIGATNADVERSVETGTLRADLYFRLNVVRVNVPSLRERPEDIEDIACHLLTRLVGGKARRLARGEWERLRQYHWPGNVRELRNVLERALVLQPEGELEPSRLLTPEPAVLADSPPSSLHAPSSQVQCRSSNAPTDGLSLSELERRHILQTLDQCLGNRARAARSLGMSVTTLRRKLNGYGLQGRETSARGAG